MSDTTETETETETETNTDTTDEPSKAELHDRVKQLESTVEKLMPSRRDALRMGVAGLAGAAGVGAATQPADAATGSAGAIGSSGSRPDLFADTVDANTVTGARQGCRVFLSSDQNMPKDTRITISFDSKVYDSDNNYNLNAEEWTCPADGLYAVTLQVQFRGGGSGDKRRALIANGNSSTGFKEGSSYILTPSNSGFSMQTSTINKYSSGDTIAGYAQNDNSSDILGSGDNNFSTFMEVAFLGGL